MNTKDSEKIRYDLESIRTLLPCLDAQQVAQRLRNLADRIHPQQATTPEGGGR